MAIDFGPLQFTMFIPEKGKQKFDFDIVYKQNSVIDLTAYLTV